MKKNLPSKESLIYIPEIELSDMNDAEYEAYKCGYNEGLNNNPNARFKISANYSHGEFVSWFYGFHSGQYMLYYGKSGH